MKFLRTRCGTWAALASVLGFTETSMSNVVTKQRDVSASLAFRVARLAKVSVDDVVSGRFPAIGTCPYCGHCPSADEVNS